MRMTLRDVPAGVATNSVTTPAYACDKYGVPPVCKARQESHEVQKICVEFYNALKSGEHQVICPFGINISYLKMYDVTMPIGLFLQTGYKPEALRNDSVTNLNRSHKKVIKRALEAMHLFKFSSINERATLNLLRQTLETLLAGRVAASMRTLTHQILTPIQGVMSDLQEIKSKHRVDGYTGDQEHFARLESNIEEINSFAKRIHILLSEDIDTSRQRIRKVTVHNVIKKICNRLESVATKKDLAFHNGYNSGIKIVEAVPDQIVIVFSCLLDNAAKYSFTGKHEWKRKIEINYEKALLDDMQALKISIRNFGCPITPDEIEERKIFELGYRGKSSGDRGRQGTGSGLCIADRIVHAHYGIIEVESKITESPTGEDQALNIFNIIWPIYFPD